MAEGGIGSSSSTDGTPGIVPADVCREMLDAALDAVFLYQVDTKRLLLANTPACEFFECGESGLGTVTLAELARRHDGLAVAFAEAAERALELGTANLSWREPIPAGGLRVIEVRLVRSSKRGAVVAVLRDESRFEEHLAEEQRARQALEASDARLRALVEATFEGISVTERGRIVYVNERILEMFGMTSEEMVGSEVSILLPPDAREAVAVKMRTGDYEPYEHLCLKKDGTIFPVEVRARPMVVDGRTLRLTAIRDISERRKADQDRERLIAELTARNAEMEQFTYTVSHDLKSPLVTISGFLGMLERDIAAGDAPRIQKDLARIGSATSKMMRLLTDLLELSRIGRVTQPKTTVSLSEIVRDALELVSGPMAERRVRIDVAPMLPDVHGDRVRLVQVVQNLLENAVKYMGDQPEPRIDVGLRGDATDTVLYVRDNGIGIDPRHHDRIFGLFEKLDPKSEGTGVGLALVRRILEFHGGSIWVESGNTGSTFVLRLPRVVPSEDRTAADQGRGT